MNESEICFRIATKKSLIEKRRKILSTILVNKYVQKKLDDITKDLPTTKAYTLGVAVGMLLGVLPI